jgi:microcystin-dependent protein
MTEPYLGEIRIFSYARGAPLGWQLCDGSLLPISQYDALFALISNIYGGDGQTTFAVPDLRGRLPIHQGQGSGGGLSNYSLGQIGGSETVTLTVDQMAAHSHLVVASTAAGTTNSPAGKVPATVANEPFYATIDASAKPYALPAATIGTAGGNAGHENSGPTLTLNYCIAWQGIFPQPS